MTIPAALGTLALPIVSAPMFLVSSVALAAAQCKAGIVGSFPSLNAREPHQLADWIDGVRAACAGHAAAPFGINLIAHKSNARFEHDAQVCLDRKVPVFLTSLQAPGDLVKAAHAYGGLVFHDVTTVRHAEKAAEQGVDGLILVCAGAGGHAGRSSPFALLPEVRRIFRGTIILAGAITDGAAVLAAQALGADLVYMGTRFIAAAESAAKDEYKRMMIDSALKDIVYTSYFSGVGANYLLPSIVAAGIDPAELEAPAKTKSDYKPGARSAVKAWRDVWGSGQGAGAVDAIEPVADIVARLKREYDAARGRVAALP